MPDELILVDAHNRAIGRAGKTLVHAQGLRHRAFSIFLVDARGRLLLQRRSLAKYHSPGLWANACCGHPRPGERTLQAAQRRLAEELGAAASLQYSFQARYRTHLANGLIEDEVVYVYFGATPRVLRPAPAEVATTTALSLAKLEADIARHPRRYAYWLRHYLQNHRGAVRRGLAGARRRARTVSGHAHT